MVIKTGHTSLLLRDALRRPLAELELGAVQASLRRPTQSVMQLYCGIHISAWSYNPTITAWEPVLESWDLIVKVDANHDPQVRLVWSCKLDSHRFVSSLLHLEFCHDRPCKKCLCKTDVIQHSHLAEVIVNTLRPSFGSDETIWTSSAPPPANLIITAGFPRRRSWYTCLSQEHQRDCARDTGLCCGHKCTHLPLGVERIGFRSCWQDLQAPAGSC